MPRAHETRRTTPPPQPLFLEADPESSASPTAKTGSPEAEPQSPRRQPAGIRSRKPVWTTLKPTIAHLLADVDARLTTACDQTGNGVQWTFEAAINGYCDVLVPPIPAEMPEDSDLQVPRDPNPGLPGTPKNEDTRKTVVRLKPNTRARLVAGCKQEQLGGKDFINDALSAYFDRLGIPNYE
ncbi:hypothetical protein ACQP1V_43060 (plasmid) [Microtetraspora malaysiensis]|uniref:hypothetical protein n=1 Tax=Microtetraspora malaysiensis TaxID=161358 RepID=UPI003D911A27